MWLEYDDLNSFASHIIIQRFLIIISNPYQLKLNLPLLYKIAEFCLQRLHLSFFIIFSCLKVNHIQRTVEGFHQVQKLKRLLQDDYPILFEGLHTCSILNNPALVERKKIYRESNIEHHYYYHLFKATGNIPDKVFFLAESLKLRWFQRILKHADLMLTVSLADEQYLRKKFPQKDIRYLPSFHRDDKINSMPGRGSYLLYQGKLSVPENIRAAEDIINHIYTDSLPDLVIAGMNPPAHLIKLIEKHSNIRLEINPDEDRMFELIREAHINLMVTSQATGLKLKLLNALFHGRYCLVNPEMLVGTGLNSACTVATTPQQFREEIGHLFMKDFDAGMIARRETIIMEKYSNKKNCESLLDILTLFYEKNPRSG